MICTWDRHGLLAKCAACCSAVKLNIRQAEAYTRADNIVLDVFRVCNAGDPSALSPTRLNEMAFLLDGALSNPPRFASLWACSRHKFLAPPLAPHRVTFDNSSRAGTTVILVEASDRLGLLCDILQAIADSGLNITQAHIETTNEIARDTFYVTDPRGQKVIDPGKLDTLRIKLEMSLTASE
jgi:[protein-PII] uridylyltransferase